ncbi:MAG: type VI secretion system ATPase TssH [Planctomycetes bacterium]|nr:type VI secretion system ATPase TssH [Planctomycetota bacterium]
MVAVSLNSLVQKLDPVVHAALEQAAWLCRSMTHYDVEIEHLLLKLLEEDDTDLQRILRHFDVDGSRLATDLTASLESLKRGNTRDTPGISPRLPDLFEAAWLHASLSHELQRIRSGNVLFALLSHHELTRIAEGISREFRRIDTEALDDAYEKIVAGSREDKSSPAGAGGAAPAAGGHGTPTGKGGGKALDQYTVDLTARARAGEIDPVLGRDPEIRLMVDILMRRRQNNPILTGEPGVGKTAVVEGFALRIAAGDVPPALKNVTVRTLDLGLLQAGAGVRGEFENRLKGVIEEVKSSPSQIILFIDEAHTMIGAGGNEGGSDAANLLKPALARGELRTIAATTWAEYKKYFEKDAALARRFQVVKVEEPSEAVAMNMLRGIGAVMEKHHRVKVLPSAIEAAVSLSSRYLPDRQLPDKAVSVLDTAAARVAVGHDSVPPALEDCSRTVADLERERDLLVRETAVGGDHAARLAEIETELAVCRARLEELGKRWEGEKALVGRILAARVTLQRAVEAASGAKAAGAKAGAAQASAKPGPSAGEPAEAPPTEAERAAALADLESAARELGELQGEEPLMLPCVDEQAVAEVIGSWTGIPVGRMMADQITTVLELERLMKARVVGQDQALGAIAQRIQTSRAGLGDPSQPIGTFLLVGPSGVGKTETALTLAEHLYGGERNLITINMSEFQEAHTVSALKGSPPGYVGYGEGGVLTEAVRRKPYSVVLLDECEKAHPDVMELFYQVFDKGQLEDGTGRMIDFKNCVILLTSNLATDKIVALCDDEDTMPDAEGLAAAIHADLTKHFKPALVGRMKVVPFFPLRADVMRTIIGLKVDKIRRRLLRHHKAELRLGDDVVQAVLDRCSEADTGARNVDHILSGTVLPELSRLVLEAMAEGRAVAALAVSVGDDGSFAYSTL